MSRTFLSMVCLNDSSGMGFLLAGLGALVGFALSLGVLYVFYFLLTLPMRRNERARLFLDLLVLGLKEGRPPDQAIVEASASRDPALGVRLHLLAAYLENGLKLSEALAKVPRLLPVQITAMLRTGERIGDVAKVLPACRKLLNDGTSQVRGALNYLIILTFMVTPFTIYIPIVLNIFVIPKFKEVFSGMTGGQLPAFTRFLLENQGSFTLLQLAAIAFMWLLTAAYIGGPRMARWVQRWLPGVPDRLVFLLPWRRKRLQRDFSAMLAVLLDAGVPEAEAVVIAGDATANRVVQRRAAQVSAKLHSGAKLPEAIAVVDDCAELRWRMTNALRGHGGFLTALAGWHEALDAKSFQLEQSAAQVTTSLLVLLNGLIVCAVVIGLFLPLIALIQHATLW